MLSHSTPGADAEIGGLEVSPHQPLDHSGREKEAVGGSDLIKDDLGGSGEKQVAATSTKATRPSLWYDPRRRRLCCLLALLVLVIIGVIVGSVVGTRKRDNPSPASSTVVAGPTGSSTVCTSGTNEDGETRNYSGLCSFACHYGYCPPGPCKCTSYGEQVKPPPETGWNGCPLPGEGEGYKGLCSYSCNHGYCPESACKPC